MVIAKRSVRKAVAVVMALALATSSQAVYSADNDGQNTVAQENDYESTVITDEVYAASPEVTIIINGEKMTFDTKKLGKPLVFNNRTFVPIRAFAEYLNYNVEWLPQTQSVSIEAVAPSDNYVDKDGNRPDESQMDAETQKLKMMLHGMRDRMLAQATDGTGEKLESCGNTYRYIGFKRLTTAEVQSFYDVLDQDPNIKFGVYMMLGGKGATAFIARNSRYSLDEIRVDYTMDVQAQLYKERTYIPLRAAAELMGYQVDWNGETYSAILTPIGQ